jgi:hypothetical protein
MKNKILYGILVLAALSAYWGYKEIRWRYFNDNTLQIEVSADLDIKKINLVWEHYNDDRCVFKNGQQTCAFEVPHGWTMTYNDSCSNRCCYGSICNFSLDDDRKDADYKFTLFKKLDTIFYEYQINGRKCGVFSLKKNEAK